MLFMKLDYKLKKTPCVFYDKYQLPIKFVYKYLPFKMQFNCLLCGFSMRFVSIIHGCQKLCMPALFVIYLAFIKSVHYRLALIHGYIWL